MTKKAVEHLTNPLLEVRGLESGTENLLNNTTIAILFFLFCLVASEPLFGSPITCQVPPDWPDSSVDYFTDICYFGQREPIGIPKKVNRSDGQGSVTVNILTGTSDFYMWVPLIPILYGSLCLLPVLFWKFVGLECFNGLDIIAFLELYAQREKEEKDKKDCGKKLDAIQPWRFNKLASQLHKWITTKRASKFGLSQTMIILVLMKWLRVVIFVFQFWLLARIFGNGDLHWGYNTVRDIVDGKPMNPLEGPFTLISGCRVQRLQMGTGHRRHFKNINSVLARCVLSTNYINAKAFLFLYWWFLFVSLISICSAIHYTIILLFSGWRKYEFKMMIPTEDHFIEQYGEPHPDLNLGKTAPLEYLLDRLGNDGFLVVQMVFDMRKSHQCDEFTSYIWIHTVVNNGMEIPNEMIKKPKKEKPPIADNTQMDGAGDRYRSGKDHKNKNKKHLENLDVVPEEEDSSSCTDVSLSKESQPSFIIADSEEEPLINPVLLSSLS